MLVVYVVVKGILVEVVVFMGRMWFVVVWWMGWVGVLGVVWVVGVLAATWWLVMVLVV